MKSSINIITIAYWLLLRVPFLSPMSELKTSTSLSFLYCLTFNIAKSNPCMLSLLPIATTGFSIFLSSSFSERSVGNVTLETPVSPRPQLRGRGLVACPARCQSQIWYTKLGCVSFQAGQRHEISSAVPSLWYNHTWLDLVSFVPEQRLAMHMAFRDSNRTMSSITMTTT